MLTEGLVIIAAFVGLAVLVAGGLLLAGYLEAKRLGGGDHHDG